MRRIVIYIVCACVVLAIAGALYLVLHLDAIVARTIESEGTRIAGAPVDVGAVEIELRRGRGTIRGLRVGNPEGFDRDGAAFVLDRISLQIDTGSLSDRPLRITEADVDEVTVHLEIDESGRTNLDRIAANARGKAESTPDEEAGEPTRIVIDVLRFEGGSVLIGRTGGEDPTRLELPGFTRRDIGGSEGATGGEIAKLVTLALARQVAASSAGSRVERAVRDEMGGAAGEAAGSIVRGLLGE